MIKFDLPCRGDSVCCQMISVHPNDVAHVDGLVAAVFQTSVSSAQVVELEL